MTPDPRWHFDRTGFPYLAVPAANVAVALLPVTKAQAEAWLGNPNGPGDDWYAEVLAVSPRAGWRVPGRVPAWQYALTGVHPAEVARLAAWLGPRFRLPTPAEWRAGDTALSRLQPAHFDQVATACDDGRGHPAVAGLIRQLRDQGRRTAAELTLLRGGVLEWVTRPGPPGALGRADPSVVGNLILDPQGFDPVALVKPDRHPAFGGRLVRTLSGGPA